MTEPLEIPITTEIREKISSLPNTTEANTYRTKAVVKLSVDGIQSEWHNVKGGLTSPEETDKAHAESIRYPIFFDPVRKIWLKTVQPETVGTSFYQMFEDRLRKSAKQQRVALEVAGLPDLKDQVRDVEVDIGGKKVYGFTAPHIGPSLEFVIFKLTGRKSGQVTDPDVADFLSHVYSLAAQQAEKLYLDFGIWTDDPSPGNILLRQDEKGVHAVLIDFSNKIQEEEYLFAKVPRKKYSPQGHLDRIRSQLSRNIRKLHEKFQRHSGIVGIPFIRDPHDIETNIENSPAMLNAVKRFMPQTQAVS